MSAQPEALLLADLWEKHSHGYARTPEARTAAELRRLHADAEESEALRERLSDLLRGTAIALRGPEPELTRWSWHDLPALAAALKAQRDALLEALKMIAGTAPCIDNLMSDKDIARAAIKAVEGEKT